MGKKERNKLFAGLLFGIVKSGLVSFLIYILSSVFINAVIYKDSNGSDRNFTVVYILMVIFYALSNYFLYIRKKSEDARPSTSDSHAFNRKDDLIAYIKNEGKYLLIVYGALAILNEIAYLISFRPAMTVFLFVFPISAIIPKIPIVRSVAAYVVVVLLLLALTIYEHSQVNEYWNNNDDQ